MKTRYYLFLGFALGLLVVAVFGSLLFRQPYTFQGSLIDPAQPAPDFTLTAADGQPFTLSSQLGRPVLIFFGYTHCPDVCPVTLSEYKQIRQLLGEQAEDVTFLFVSVDPDRDTPEVLGAYTSLFDPAIVGLTDTFVKCQSVWDDYGVVRAERDSSSDGYLVDHTARTYLVDPDGNLRLTYPFGFGPQGIAEDLKFILSE